MVVNCFDELMDPLDSIKASIALLAVFQVIYNRSDLKLLTLLDYLPSDLVNSVDAATPHVSTANLLVQESPVHKSLY